MSKYAERWKRAKLLYKRTVGEKKPSAKMMGADKYGTGIDKLLLKLDAISAKMAKVKPGQQSEWLAEFGRANDEYVKVSDKYIALLKQIINAENAGPARAPYLKGLVVLQTELKATRRELQAAIALASARLQTENKQRAEVQEVYGYLRSIRARGLAQSAKVKANPSSALYNEYVADIVLQMRGAAMRLKTLDNVPGQVRQKLDGILGEFMVQLPQNAQPAQVLARVAQFEAAMNRIKQEILPALAGP